MRANHLHAAVATLLLIGTAVLLSPVRADLRGNISNAIFLVVIFASFASLGRASQLSEGRARRVWAGVTIVAITQAALLATTGETFVDENPSAPIAILVGPLCAGVSIWALHEFAAPITDRTDRIALHSDAVWVGAAGLAGLWPVVGAPVLNSPATVLSKVALVTHIAMTALLLGCAVALAFHSKAGHRRAVFDVAVGLVAWQAMSVIYDAGWLRGGIDPSSRLAALYGPPALLLAWTALGGWRSAARFLGAPPSFRNRAVLTGAPLAVIAIAVISARGAEQNWRFVITFAAFVLVARMTGEIRRSERLAAELEERTKIDPLTGVVSRTSLAALLEDRHEPIEGALLIDLDRFKHINDQLGRSVGDLVLTHVARRILGACGPEWRVARAGGDEFAALARIPVDDADLATTAERILDALARPFEVNGRQVWIGASIGAAAPPNRPLKWHAGATGYQMRERSNTVVALAELALRDAKKAGRGELRLADDALLDRLDDVNELAGDITIGLQRGEFEVHYQPQVDLVSGSIVGVEALVRWQHPTRGLMTPGEFLYVAEAAGRIADIDEHVLRMSLIDLARWNRFDRHALRLSVNMSAWQLARQDIAEGFREHLRTHHGDVDSSQLIVELPEMLLVDAPEATRRRLDALVSTGVTVSVDDFGAGFTSIAHLREFPIDEVKIDQQLTGELGDTDAQRSVAAAVIALARSLDIRTVAEGVESVEHAVALRGLGCRVGQGYLFSPAVPAQVIDAWLSDSHRFVDELGGRAFLPGALPPF